MNEGIKTLVGDEPTGVFALLWGGEISEVLIVTDKKC